MGDERVQQASLLIWGDEQPSDEIFLRWAQGLHFSATEPTALEQIKGGPCGVLAPLEAFILKSLLFHTDGVHDWRSPGEGLADSLLVHACTQVLCKAARVPAPHTEPTAARNVIIAMHPRALEEGYPVTYQAFIEGLELCEIALESDEEVEGLFASLLPHFRSAFGVLLLLYSIVLTRGYDNVKEDMGPDGDVLITRPFGHASQGLLNLVLTGAATQNVWDGDQDAGGLILRGVAERCEVGYLTVVEALHYLKVGSHFKDPVYPIWVLGSESHFTVLFSLDSRLVERKANPVQEALRAFDQHDETGGGFVAPIALPGLLAKIGQDNNEERVKTLTEKMDPDRLGVILRTNFVETLFPGMSSEEDSTPPTFTVYHYNGIARPGSQVHYVRGEAQASSPQDFGSADIMRCLRTKWKKLVINWNGGQVPSIN